MVKSFCCLLVAWIMKKDEGRRLEENYKPDCASCGNCDRFCATSAPRVSVARAD
jgi:Na+-translocating ferredoxin:NAD+ oxidoreductase RnfC subunit